MSFFSGWLIEFGGYTSIFIISSLFGFVATVIFITTPIQDNTSKGNNKKNQGSTVPFFKAVRQVSLSVIQTFLLNFWISFIRSAYSDWGILELKEGKNFTPVLAGQCHFWHNLGGIVHFLADTYQISTLMETESKL